MIAGSLTAQAVFLALLVLGAVRLRVSAREAGRALLGIASVLAFVLAANALWYLLARGADRLPPTALLQPSGWALLVARLGNLLILGGLTGASTTPAETAAAVDTLLRPLARLHAPIREAGFAAALAIGFVPLLREEARRIGLALQLRQGKRRRPAWARARLAVPLAVPLFVGVLRRADEVALALDARAFDPSAGRSHYLEPGTRREDLLLLLISGALLGLALYS